MSVSDALIIFAKMPDPLTTKTRLCPPLSASQAAELYACFLDDTLDNARRVRGAARILAFDPPGCQAGFERLAPDFECLPQAGEDLGRRMHQALAALLGRGFERVALTGSDLPHLDPHILAQAFAQMRQGAEVVLGPSADGGYYLVGLTRPAPELFDLPMSTPTVYQETAERAARLGLRLGRLPASFDVDTGDDLARLRAYLSARPEIPARRTREWLAANEG